MAYCPHGAGFKLSSRTILATGGFRHGRACTGSRAFFGSVPRPATFGDLQFKKGTASRQYFRLFEDSKAMSGSEWRRRGATLWPNGKVTNTFRTYTAADGIGPVSPTDLPRTTAETSGSGSILAASCDIGMTLHQICRGRGAPTVLFGGCFSTTRDTYGLPPATRAYSRSITRRPKHPVFSHLTTSDGLASNQVTTVIEDKFDHLISVLAAGWTG